MNVIILSVAAIAIGVLSSGSSPQNPNEQSASKQTFVYRIQGQDSLEIDLHVPPMNASDDALFPVVLFVHGGGFYTGTRKENNIIAFCDSLAAHGYLAVNVSYRLALKGKSFSCKQPVADKINAIATAAEDIRFATNWLLEQQQEFNIDPNAIFLAGSSAGAEAILHAAYAPIDYGLLNPENITSLPKHFNYKGLLSFAGAVLDTSWVTPETALPSLFYHGNCDALVPYGSALHHYCKSDAPGAMMLHGSYTLCNRLENINTPVRLVTACGGQHGSAVYPIEKEITEIVHFLDEVMNNRIFFDHDVRQLFDKPCPQLGEWEHCSP